MRITKVIKGFFGRRHMDKKQYDEYCDELIRRAKLGIEYMRNSGDKDGDGYVSFWETWRMYRTFAKDLRKW